MPLFVEEVTRLVLERGVEQGAQAIPQTLQQSLAARLAPVPVRLVDERFTTVIAHDVLRQGGRGSRERRPTVDKAAAALILIRPRRDQHAINTGWM